MVWQIRPFSSRFAYSLLNKQRGPGDFLKPETVFVSAGVIVSDASKEM